MEENLIKIHLPVSVTYPALESVLRKKLIGTYIPKPEEGVEAPPYAQVLDVGISGSSAAAQEVILRIKIKVLRTVLKRDEVDLYVLATLGYDNVSQQLYVAHFQLNARTSSGFYNTALEVLANKVAYSQIIKKARVDVKSILDEELLKANRLLGEGVELKGVKLLGAVREMRVLDVTLLPKKVTLAVECAGDLQANVLDLSGLA